MFPDKFIKEETGEKAPSKNSTKLFKSLSGLGVGIVVLMAATLVPSLLRLRTAYDLEQFFPQGDTTYREAQKIREKYHLSENPSAVFLIELPGEKTWTDPDLARRLASFTREVQQNEGVENTLSFATRAGAEFNDRNIQVGVLTELLDPSIWKSRFREDPLMTPLLLSPDQKTALLVVEMKTTDLTQMKALFEKIETGLRASFVDSRVSVGGIPALQAGFQTLLEAEIFRFVLFGFLATYFVIFALFRGWAPVLVSFLTVIVSNVVILGGLSAFGFSLTVLTVTLPILITVTVLAQIIHTFFRLHEERETPGLRKHWSVQRGLLLPNFFANFTTAIGFLTLAPNDIPMIANYGWAVAGSIMASWITASLLLPLLTISSPPPEPRSWSQFKSRWVLLLLRSKREWALAGIALTLVCSAGAFALNWNNRLFDDLPAEHVSRLSTERLDQDFGGVIPLNIEIKAPTESFWKQPEVLQKLDQQIGQIREISAVGQVLSLVDFVKAFDKESSLPKSAQATSELLFLYGLSSQNPLKSFLTPDGKDLRLQVRLRDVPSSEMASTVNQIQRQLQQAFPELPVSISGMANHLHPINNRVSADLIFGFWQAMLAILVVLIPAFRSLRWALVACLPNLLPPAVLLAAMALLQTPIKPPLALIFSISLGLAFNNTIYVFSRLMDLKAKGRKARLIEHVFHREGMNCLHSTLVVVAGFAVFLFAQFSVNQSFGAFMLLSIFAGLFGDLVVLPALLAWQPGLLGLAAKPSTTEPLPLSQNQRSSPMLSKAASFLFFALFLTHASKVQAQHSTAELEVRFKKALKQFQTRDEEARVKLSILEPDGSKTVREVDLQRAGSGNEQRMLARIISPSDLKGMGLLSVVTSDSENQWVYLPSSKQVRKIVGAESSEGGVLGSELRYEDFDPSVIRLAQIQYRKTESINGHPHDLLEVSFPKGKSPYERAEIWIQNGLEIPVQIDYFAQGQKVKTLKFLNYKKVGSVLRPHRLVIQNLKTKRGTEIELSQVKVNRGLKPQKLSVDSLAKAW